MNRPTTPPKRSTREARPLAILGNVPNLLTSETTGRMDTLGGDMVERQTVEASPDQISGDWPANPRRTQPACVFTEVAPTDDPTEPIRVDQRG